MTLFIYRKLFHDFKWNAIVIKLEKMQSSLLKNLFAIASLASYYIEILWVLCIFLSGCYSIAFCWT